MTTKKLTNVHNDKVYCLVTNFRYIVDSNKNITDRPKDRRKRDLNSGDMINFCYIIVYDKHS